MQKTNYNWRYYFAFVKVLWFLQSLDIAHADEENIIINAQHQIICNDMMLQCTATGYAEAQKGDVKIYGDVLKVFYVGDKKKEIKSFTAEGNVRIITPTEEATGDFGYYDVVKDYARLTGENLKLTTPQVTVTAVDSLEYWRTLNKGVANKNAIARFSEKQQILQGDTLFIYFTPEQNEDKDQIHTQKVNSSFTQEKKLTLDHIVAIGNVFVSQPSEIITGEKAIYNEKTHVAEIMGHVKATKNNNQIEGEYARTHLQTHLTEMFAVHPNKDTKTENHKQRIRGYIIPRETQKSSKPSLEKNK